MTRRAFTLVELLVVVGIMAAMGTMSIGGYFAAARGMADRGAISTATSVISLAHERARMDLTPTVVYFYNETVQNKDNAKGKDLIVVGVAVAVRMGGRITRVNAGRLGDEFGDLDRAYSVAESANTLEGDTFRLYKFNFSGMKYSSVYSEVVEDAIGGEKFLVEQPRDRNFRKANGDNEDPTEIISYAFKKLSDFGSPGWTVGDAYGYEFARVRLPDNYIFENEAPTESDPVKVVSKVVKCYPADDASSLEKIKIFAKRPSGWKAVGTTASEMKDI